MAVDYMTVKSIKANFYHQFDADYDMEVPAEGFSGWQEEDIEIDLERTALVVMHAWDCGTRDQFPGWYRYVEYIPRANRICKEVFPSLLDAVRGSSMKIFHVVSSGSYYKNYPSYTRARKKEKKTCKPFSKISKGSARKKLDRFRDANCGAGLHNKHDISEGFKRLDFAPEAKPEGDEGIAENADQLFALCKESGVDHLIYVGFAINWCLLLSPGGMAEMSKYGLLCSTIKEAVTAVENDFTARQELCKEIALWRVSLAFGFVFQLDDVLKVLK
ncbi:MAG: hypothetical protein ACFFCS_24650 [Candidatus Hodarchaeota archaeon]